MGRDYRPQEVGIPLELCVGIRKGLELGASQRMEVDSMSNLQGEWH